MPVDLALRYSTNYNSNIFSFVNNINTIEGGTHLSGFRSALTRALNNYANKNDLIKTKKNEKFSLSGDDFREGLTVVISVKVQEPQFEGQTKTKLGNGEVKGLVDNVVYDGIQAFLEQNPKVGKRIIEKAAEAARARIAAKKARELVRKKSDQQLFQENWQIVQIKILCSVNCFLLRETLLEVQLNREETEELRLFYPCAERLLIQKRQEKISF